MKPGDRIAKVNGTPVWTFGDLQYHYEKVPREAKQVRIAVDRASRTIDLPIALPAVGG